MPESSPHAAPTPLPLPSTPQASATDRDACAVCHSPLRPEARYCLQCGARRAGARLEFLDVLDERSGPAAAGASAPARRPVPAATLPTPLDPLRSWPFGLTAVVLLALLIGLLAGHWIDDRGDDTAGTQVIRVEGTAAGAAGTAAPAASSAAPASTAPSSTAPAATAEPKATAPKKITRDSEKQALDDTSGNENLAPEDSDPNGANFDEIK